MHRLFRFGPIAAMAFFTAVVLTAPSCTVMNGVVLRKCEAKRFPSRPTNADRGGETFVSAVLRFDFGSRDNPIGYDLDNVCSCYLGGPESCQNKIANCDLGIDGTDNSASTLITEFDKLYFDGQLATIAASTAARGRSVLLQVSGYSGEPDDPSVRVSVFPAVGVEATTDGGVPDGGDVAPNPKGGDRWYRASRGVTLLPGAGVIAKIILDGYVRNNVLIAQSKDPIPIPFPGTIDIPIHDLTLVANAERTPEGVVIREGTITGAWNVRDAILGLMNFETRGTPTCKTPIAPLVLPTVVQRVCEAADLHNEGNPKATCNQLSLAMKFSAVPGFLGEVVEAPDATNVCGDPPPCPP